MVAALAATLVLSLPAVWGAIALWYQAPGGLASKLLCVLLWASFSAAVILSLIHI